MDNLPSGLHKYAGNYVHTKFRIVLTDPVMISKKWNNNRGSTPADKYQIRKSTSIKENDSNLNVQYQASYLVAKSPSSNEWVVVDGEEEAIGVAGRGEDSSTGGIDSATMKSRNENETRCFGTILRQEGFVLSVVNVPSESRIKCHVCQRKLFKDCATIIDDFDRKRGNRLVDEDKQENGQMVGGCAAGDRFAPLSTQLEGRENANNIRNTRHNDVSKDFWNLFSERKRASRWKDTLDMTSASISNGYWRSVDARKLAIGLGDSLLAEHNSRAIELRASTTASLLMRNHHFPPCEPCQCSRIKSARADKAIDDFCASPLVCALCLTNNGSASDNNENRNSLDRRKDNLEIPMNEILRCRCRSTNCFSPHSIVRHCRCAELKDGYKRCQKLLNRLVEGSAIETMADPPNDNLMSSFKFNSHKSDNIEAKALNRKLAKLTELNGIDDSLDLGSCDVLASSLLSDLDLPQETNEQEEFDDETDLLLKVNEALDNPQASTQQEGCSHSGDAAAGFSTRRLKSVHGSEDNSANRAKETSGHVCYCTESHGETLLVLLEKYKPGSLRLRPNEKAAPSRRTQEERSSSQANGKNGAIIDESLEKNDLEGMDEQSRDQRKSQQDLIASGAEQSIGMLASAIATSSYGSTASADRTDDSNQRRPMRSGIQAPNSAKTTEGDHKDNFNTQLRLELPLSARKLNVDNQAVRHDVQRDYSVVLAVIVIDAFNGTIQVKPDLNELVLLDMSTLNARTNEIPNATIINSLRAGANDPSQSRPDRRAQIFHHIEVFESSDDMEASERDLRFLRDTLGLQKHIYDLPQFGEELFQKHSIGKQMSIYRDPSSTVHKEGFFIELQFDIHYAYKFPTDCKNIYIRYKIYSVEHESWHIRRLSEAPDKRDVNKKLRDGSLIPSNSSTTLSRVGEDKTKLEHMTHIRPNIWTPNDSGISDTNFVARDIAPVASDKWLILGGGQHDVNQASVMESCRRDSESDSDNYDHGYDEDGDDQCPLLLEGSTITSRPDSRGHFNFCCVEQLLLELSRKTTRLPGDNRRKFSASRIKQDDAIIPPKETKGQEKISAEIDEQKRTKSNDRNQMQIQTKVVHSSTADRLITESLEHLPSADSEQISSPVTANENSTTRTEMDHETDNIFPSEEITIEQSRANNDTSICNKSPKSIDRPSDQSSDGRPSKSSQITTDGLLDDTLCNNLGGVCQIIFLFEIYSRDFYSDKLKGWSSMKVPISLERDGICQPVLNFHNKPKQRSYGRVKCRRTFREPRHHELPVMRPALSAPMDRLRYYLLGEIPMKTPTTASVSIILGTDWATPDAEATSD